MTHWRLLGRHLWAKVTRYLNGGLDFQSMMMIVDPTNGPVVAFLLPFLSTVVFLEMSLCLIVCLINIYFMMPIFTLHNDTNMSSRHTNKAFEYRFRNANFVFIKHLTRHMTRVPVR